MAQAYAHGIGHVETAEDFRHAAAGGQRRAGRAFEMVGDQPGPPLGKSPAPVAVLVGGGAVETVSLPGVNYGAAHAGRGLGREPEDIGDAGHVHGPAQGIEGPVLLQRQVPGEFPALGQRQAAFQRPVGSGVGADFHEGGGSRGQEIPDRKVLLVGPALLEVAGADIGAGGRA